MSEIIAFPDRTECAKGNNNPSVVRSKQTRFVLKVGLIELETLYNKLAHDDVSGMLINTMVEFKDSLIEHEKIITDNGGTFI